MSHVDEGTLHAYLDGEVTPVERARLDAHLAECAACRARLEEERGLIERAGQLLGLATPPGPDRAMPPLHQLRHPRPWLRWRVPLAWAATVVLALGAGWYARATLDPRSAPTVSGFGPREEGARENTTLAPADSGVTRDRPTRPTAAPTARLEAKTAPAADRDQLAARQRVAEGDSAAGSAAGALSAPAPAAAAAQENKVAAAVQPVTVADRRISADSARRLLGRAPATIPSLAVVSIQKGTDGAIVVEQRLDPRTTILLHEWPVEQRQDAPPLRERAAAPAPAPAVRSDLQGRLSNGERLARYVGVLRIEISGPLPADSLSKLLEAVRPED